MRLPSLMWVRYSLLAASALSTLFITSQATNSDYIIQVLLFMLVVRARDFKSAPARFRTYSLPVEAFGAFWLTFQYGGLFYFAYLSLLCSLFDGKSRPYRIPCSVLLFVLLLVSLEPAGLHVQLPAAISFGTAFLLLYRTGRMEVGREELQQLYDELRKKHYELDEARKRIIEYAQKVENSAQWEERNRIAREIHDDLGHKLIRLKMMLEAIVRIMPVQPDKGMELLLQVRDQLTGSMETMRRTVRRLKPEEDDRLSYSLDRLMEDLSREPGYTVNYRVEGMPFPIYPSCEVVLYRNTQEAITNALRHGKADLVDVTLSYQEQEIVLTIWNNGQLPDHMERKGLGLTGMEERTRLVGGHLSVSPDPVFTVETRIPLIRT